jgi:sugar phosphate isomerase/epimerase
MRGRDTMTDSLHARFAATRGERSLRVAAKRLVHHGYGVQNGCNPPIKPESPTMLNRMTRRKALGLTTAAATTFLAAKPASAIEPIKRNGKPKFKFSLAAYSYRDLLQGKNGSTPELTLDDFIADCAKMQLDGTELTSYYFPEPVTDDYLNHLKSLTFRLGLDISGTSTRNDFCYPPGPERDKELAFCKEWVDYAAKMGAPVIRVFSGNNRKDQTQADAERLAIEGLEECCDYAGKKGVFLALENHGGLTATVDGMLKVVKGVNSPWFGVNYDSANFRSETPYEDLARIAPYALNVQLKVSMKGAEGPSQPADYKRFAKMLSDVGYRGYIVLEFEEKEQDPRTECPKQVERIREAFA